MCIAGGGRGSRGGGRWEEGGRGRKGEEGGGGRCKTNPQSLKSRQQYQQTSVLSMFVRNPTELAV